MHADDADNAGSFDDANDVYNAANGAGSADAADDAARTAADLPQGLASASSPEEGRNGDAGALSRRGFLSLSLAAVPVVGLATTTLHAAGPAKPSGPAAAESGPAAPAEIAVALEVNGQAHRVRIDPRRTLLDLLREELALPGTKKGCDHGQCGACTVLVDGRRVLSCLSLAAMASGHRITTIEGLANGGHLHPLQAAFLKHDALQCGYCTPGQIVSAVGLLREGCPDDPAAIREQMSGNLCRCGAYPNIVAAIAAIAATPETPQIIDAHRGGQS